jgi:glucosamine--fructose-6-phosphate aminotransferase (isomerizing)
MSRSIGDYRLYGAITRQPAELQRLLTADEPVGEAAARVGGATRVFTIGIGTSSNAAAAAATMLRAAGVDARPWSSHDFVSYPPALRAGDAAIVFTHSGRKRFSRGVLEPLAAAGVGAIVITGTETALTAADLAPGTVVLKTVTRDPSAMFTVSHTTAMLLAARIADAVRPGSVGDLSAVPDAVAGALKLEPEIAALAQAWAPRGAIVALGAGPHEPSAHEAHIKIAEASRRPVRSYAVEQFVHGPQVQVTADESFLVFAGEGPGLARTRDVVAFVRALGCDVAWVAPVAAPEGARWLNLPAIAEPLAPIVEAVPAQLLAGHLAALADVDGDNFRSDDEAHRTAVQALGL